MTSRRKRPRARVQERSAAGGSAAARIIALLGDFPADIEEAHRQRMAMFVMLVLRMKAAAAAGDEEEAKRCHKQIEDRLQKIIMGGQEEAVRTLRLKDGPRVH